MGHLVTGGDAHGALHWFKAHFYKASNSAPIIAQAKKMQTYSYVPESVKKIVRETVLAKKTMMMGLKNFEQQVRKMGEEDPSASI